MSVVTVQFGQCGNQIGQTLYSTVHEDLKLKNSKCRYHADSVSKWFNVTKKSNWEPRAVLVDTEIKVTSDIHTPYMFKNVVSRSLGGSANNWAYAFSNISKLLVKDVLNCVRSEVEKCDNLDGLLNIFSLSGGTGSGLGSFVVGKLREEYPSKNIVSAVVLPYQDGEIVTQSYNSVLSLSHLQIYSDSVLLIENERLHDLCKFALNINEVKFKDINNLISQQLVSLYQPIRDVSTSNVLNNLCSNSLYKFLQLKTEPNFCKRNIKYETTHQWQVLLDTLSKSSRFDLLQQKRSSVLLKPKYIGVTLIAHSSIDFDDKTLKPFKDYTFVDILPSNNCFKTYYRKVPFLNHEKYVTMISNGNGVCLPFNHILDDAWKLFTHGVYLHHYKKNNIDEDYFLNSFQILENVVGGYKQL